jgi:hypothetical protein
MTGSLSDIKKYDYIVIDGMNYAYRCFFGMSLSFEEVSTSVLYGFANLLVTQKRRNNRAKFIVLWEGDNSWRREKYPTYKCKRGKKKDDEMYKRQQSNFFASVDMTKKFMQYVGVYQVFQATLEADDLAAFFAHRYENVLLVSNDKDWQTLLNKADIMVSDKIYTKDDYDPFLFWTKVIRGDSSDSISPSLPYLPKDKFDKLISCDLTLENIPDILGSLGYHDWEEKARGSFSSLLKMNFDLVSLHCEMVDPGKFEYIRDKYKPDKAKAILSSLGMNKMVYEYEKIAYRINGSSVDE